MDAIRLLAALATAFTLSTTVWAQFQPTQPVAEMARNSRAPEIPTRITNNPDFGIPFQMANSQTSVSEVQLHVSTDQGARWSMYQKQAPGANGFQFHANNDGEYWFAVHTVERGQDPRDFNQAQLRPELKVVVDTKKPQLDIRVNVDPTGQATAEWQAQDLNLVASSFRMQYQDQNGRWQDVPVRTPGERDLRNRWQSQSQFFVRARGEEAMVRAEVVDRAGNSKLINKRISLAGGGNGPGFESAASRGGPVGQSWNDLTSGIRNKLPSFLRNVEQPDENTFGATNPRNWANLEPANDSAPRRSDSQFGRNAATATDTARLNPRGNSFGQRSQPRDRNQNTSFRNRQDDSFASNRSFTPNPNNHNYNREYGNGRADSQANRPVADNRFDNRGTNNRGTNDRNFASRTPSSDFDNEFGNRNRPRQTGRQQTGRPQAGTQQSGRSQYGLQQSNQQFQDPMQRPSRSNFDGPVARQRPQGTATRGQERMFQPRITASPNFELVYDLYGIDSRPERVELWFTRDRGRTWEAYGADSDRQSPMEVRTKNEGLYGFQLLVDGGRGNVPEPPRDGDDADVWVVVDWTKPTGSITRVNPLSSGREVTIEWVAEDTLLADTPITLSFSDNPDGPWTPITSRSIPNSGAYQWQVDRRLPQRFFVQLEVRDMAGNVTSHVSDSRGGVTGRILDVRPLGR